MVSRRFVVKRLLLLVPVLFGVATLVFAILHLSPGNPARVIAGNRASEEFVRQVERELGLDRPIWVQYLDYLTDVATLDFGNSYRIQKGDPVRQILATKLPVTVELAVYGQLVGILLGIPLGIVSAIRQNQFTDHFTRVGALVGISHPIFYSGPLLILLFAQGFILKDLFGMVGLADLWETVSLPASGRISTRYQLADAARLSIPIVGGVSIPATNLVTLDSALQGNVPAFISAVRHMILPAGVIGIYSTALISRMMRSSMLEVVRQDYMRTARAKGQGARITILKHGFRNAMIPVITIIGIQFGTLLGGAVLTETVFGIGGVGVTLVRAIEVNDYPVVQGTVLTFAALFTLVNLLVDITYSYLDPRIDQ